MIEKRFIIVKSIENYYTLVDKERANKEQILILSLHKEQLSDVANLLNEQQATITELKEENEVLFENLSEGQEYYIKSEKEYHERVMNYQTEIKRLKCMNNQLEKRLDYSIAYDMGECE